MEKIAQSAKAMERLRQFEDKMLLIQRSCVWLQEYIANKLVQNISTNEEFGQISSNRQRVLSSNFSHI